ncbi:tyrosine-type recombinase/integrase [Brevundimonas pondensis]|uniref:Tyrosine-type recombinase/integrase n=1 Tax=Brevundimonas pondensis TaxID=2774189 RepID=A0ABX7SLJ9_9CAUL|nr:tyrosine-type recombinase/integrase [Brevundimonas pondensis]QTC87923.1 tyrosine-type recombinase/integrase [Brevundimonas pondensis]
MSVYKPAKSRFWQYDFQHKGRRFHGSTGVEGKRDAEAVERRIRIQAAKGELDDASRMTLDVAVSKWWDEKGSTLKGGERLEARLARMIALVGPNTPLSEITTEAVGRAIQKRRGQTLTKSKAKGAKAYLPSNSTVNRDMIDTLRPVLNRARKAWGAKLPVIDWAELRMAEPKPKPKEFAGDELALVLAEVQPHWHDMIHFAARYGCRLSELFFSLDDLDVSAPENARVKLRNRKGGDDHTIPLLPDDAAMLAARLGRARKAEIGTVWFREKASKVRGRPPRVVALTYNGAAIALRRAMERSGLKASKGMRGAHDLRHHSAMQMLRATGNLRVAQKLLGHADIKSTLVYAHAVEADVRAGLAALSRNSPEPTEAESGKDAAEQPAKGKSSGAS